MRLTADHIIEVIATYYGVRVEALRSESRARTVSEARLFVYGLCRDLTELSLPEIGAALNRDHSTVRLGLLSLSQKIRRRPALAERFYKCRQLVLTS